MRKEQAAEGSSTASYVSSVHLSYSGYRQQHRRKERASGWPWHHRSTARRNRLSRSPAAFPRIMSYMSELEISGERKIALSDSSAQETPFHPAVIGLALTLLERLICRPSSSRPTGCASRCWNSVSETGWRFACTDFRSTQSRGGTRYQCSREWAIASGPLISADGRTTRPTRVADYTLPHLVDDVMALIDAAHAERDRKSVV